MEHIRHISIIGPKKCHFGQLVPENGPPSSQMGPYRKTEGIQSYLGTWESYDPTESGPSEAKMGQACRFLAKNLFFCEVIQTFCDHHDETPKIQGFCVEPHFLGSEGSDRMGS